MPRHFLDLDAVPAVHLRAMLDDAKALKTARAKRSKGARDHDARLGDRVLAMIFEKPSTRTRFSFEMAMHQQGGRAIVVSGGQMHLGQGETVEDTARVLGRYVDAVMIRAKRHSDVEAFAVASPVPVVNALTDRTHPCQILAAMQTFEERGLELDRATLAWLGDGNNVCASYIHGASAFGYRLRIASPEGYRPDAALLDGADGVELCGSPEEAVGGADVVIADTFVSMGDTDREARLAALMPFQVTPVLMAKAKPNALFSHCLPAHRGEEVAAEVIDGPQSVVFDEAENRLHAQKAVLRWCLHANAQAA